MVHIIPHRQREVSIPAEFYPALDMVDVLKKFFLCILGLNPTASASQWNDTLLITSIILPISSSDKVCTSLPFNTQLFAKLTAHPIMVFYETSAAQPSFLFLGTYVRSKSLALSVGNKLYCAFFFTHYRRSSFFCILGLHHSFLGFLNLPSIVFLSPVFDIFTALSTSRLFSK